MLLSRGRDAALTVADSGSMLMAAPRVSSTSARTAGCLLVSEG